MANKFQTLLGQITAQLREVRFELANEVMRKTLQAHATW